MISSAGDGMEKRVRITMKATRKQAGEKPEVMEFVTYGIMCRYGAKYRISYKESDMFGANGVTSAFIIENGKLSMERTGKLNARMEFLVGEKTETMYNTEYGTMLMGVTARRAEANICDDGGTILAEYAVELQHTFIGTNIFEIKVEPSERKGIEEDN